MGTEKKEQTAERKAYEALKAKPGTSPEVEEHHRRLAIKSEADLVPNSAEWFAAGNGPTEDANPYAGMRGNRSGGMGGDHG